MNSKDLQIIAQSSLKAAVDATADGTDPAAITAVADVFFDWVLKTAEAAGNELGVTQQATNVVVGGFPAGSVSPQPTAPAGSPPPMAPAAPPAPPVAPTAASGGGNKAEALWRQYFENPDQWWDNRGDSRASSGGGKGPDFRHKDTGEGLWLSGKYPAPEWVQNALNGQSF